MAGLGLSLGDAALGLGKPAGPAMPTKLARQNPIWGGIMGDRSLTGSAEYLEQFRGEYDRFQGAVKAAKRLDEAGWSKEDLREEYADAVFLTPAGQARFKDAKKRLDSLSRSVREVYTDDTMLPDAKRAKLDGIYEEMEDTARWALGAKRLPREHAPVPTGSKGGQKRYAPLPGALRAR
jgi:hypothetical protein